MKPVAITALVLLSVGTVYFVVTQLNRHPPIDAAFAERWTEIVRPVGVDPQKTAFREGGGLSLFALTPEVQGKVYVIEALYFPGHLQCWARLHDTSAPVDAFHPKEMATAEYRGGAPATRSYKNCGQETADKLFEYFDGIRAAARKTAGLE